jgi:hypothetical protein
MGCWDHRGLSPGHQPLADELLACWQVVGEQVFCHSLSAAALQQQV